MPYETNLAAIQRTRGEDPLLNVRSQPSQQNFKRTLNRTIAQVRTTKKRRKNMEEGYGLNMPDFKRKERITLIKC